MADDRRDDVWVLSYRVRDSDGGWRVQAVRKNLADCFEEPHTDDPSRTWTVVWAWGSPQWLHSPAAENSGEWKITLESLDPPGSAYHPPYEHDPDIDALVEQQP